MMRSRAPNILLVVTDQQRVDTVGAYGSPICRTPAMDRVAAEGMRFDNAFTPCGLCSPVRCSLLSGVYPHGHKVLTNVSLHPIRESLEPEQDRLTPMLKAAGYRLGCVGKWHVHKSKTPIDFGYDDHVSLADYLDWRKGAGIPIPDAMLDYTVQRAELDPAPPEHSRPEWLADRSIDLLEACARDRGRPFFLRLDFHGPHFPNVVPEPYKSMYDPAAIPPWPNAADPLDGKPAVQRIKQQHWKTDSFSWADWQPLVATYFGEISLIDHAVGRVLERLAALGLADETLVVWTTDHGDTIGAHGICNKDYTMYEEIYRVPMVVRWPGVVPPGTRTDVFTHHFLDLFATFHEVASGAVPADTHGRSLVPVLGGEPVDRAREAYAEFHGSHMGLYSMRLLRTERWSYIYHTNDIDELYDHDADPWQLRNLAKEPAAAATLRELRRRMVDWMARTDDHLYNEWTVLWLTDDPGLAAEAPGRRRSRW